jgi:hypothetical protein
MIMRIQQLLVLPSALLMWSWWMGVQLAAVVVVVVVNAEKDSDYYLPGFSNPNAVNEMYWKDSLNVLQDIDQFDALYVTYHGCVWSKVRPKLGAAAC